MRIDKFSNFKKRWLQFALIFLVVAAMLSIPHLGAAKTVFYGVGNDGYFSDVVGIQTALSSSIGADDFISYAYANLSGNDIYDTTVALSPFLSGDDTLVWYYSGHGGFVPDDVVGDETRSGSTALDSYDEVIGLQGDRDWLTDDELADALNGLVDTTSNLLVIADMCYAGGLVGGTSDLNPASGLTFFGSSSELDSSYSFTSDSYSLFTDSLIDGLSNWAADSDSDGILLTSEWFQYSYDLTVDRLGVQHPVFFGEDLMIASQTPAPVPIPGTVFLLGPGLFSIWLRKKFGKID
jgi:hypothetical protein